MTYFKKEKFLKGGIVATMIPIIIGGFLLILPIVNETHRNDSYWMISAPIIFSFIFITPIIAYRCISKLKNMEEIAWADLFSISLIESTIANFWIALIYNGVFSFFLSQGYTEISEAIVMILIFVIFCTLVQLILWAFITFPLSLICAAVFGEVVKGRIQP